MWQVARRAFRKPQHESFGYLLEKGMQEVALDGPFAHPKSLYNMAVGPLH